MGYEAGWNLYAYVNNDPLNGADPTGRQFFKVYDPEQAVGLGHVGFGYRDQQSGETTVGEFTGQGELFVSNFMSDSTDQAVSGAMSIFDSRWDSGNNETMNASIFTDANDTAGFNEALAGVERMTAGEGETPLPGDIQDSMLGRNPEVGYNLATCNCATIANIVGQGAGADVSRNLIPNFEFREEIAQPGVDAVTTIRDGESVREWRY